MATDGAMCGGIACSPSKVVSPRVCMPSSVGCFTSVFRGLAKMLRGCCPRQKSRSLPTACTANSFRAAPAENEPRPSLCDVRLRAKLVLHPNDVVHWSEADALLRRGSTAAQQATRLFLSTDQESATAAVTCLATLLGDARECVRQAAMDVLVGVGPSLSGGFVEEMWAAEAALGKTKTGGTAAARHDKELVMMLRDRKPCTGQTLELRRDRDAQLLKEARRSGSLQACAALSFYDVCARSRFSAAAVQGGDLVQALRIPVRGRGGRIAAGAPSELLAAAARAAAAVWPQCSAAPRPWQPPAHCRPRWDHTRWPRPCLAPKSGA
eukprot:TRINITY_DN58477_c0_g1_i1.p1 TRINITY_DN58477_c0_g1~~TRINITY_DN58477_c0_g1_i1.p1  ORF type:complete len:324 (+),score=39.75 TRINITY_DN58477_c0_g1_i1:95-1066(+)